MSPQVAGPRWLIPGTCLCLTACHPAACGTLHLGALASRLAADAQGDLQVVAAACMAQPLLRAGASGRLLSGPASAHQPGPPPTPSRARRCTASKRAPCVCPLCPPPVPPWRRKRHSCPPRPQSQGHVLGPRGGLCPLHAASAPEWTVLTLTVQGGPVTCLECLQVSWDHVTSPGETPAICFLGSSSLSLLGVG